MNGGTRRLRRYPVDQNTLQAMLREAVAEVL